MKTITLILVLVLSSASIAQDVRTFYQSYSDFNYTTSMYEYNNEVYFVSIKDSSSSMLKIVTGRLDDQLNTTNYRYQYVIKPTFETYQLSGSIVNGNYLLLAILRRTNGINKLDYITIDLTSFLVVSNVTVNEQFKLSFARSLPKNGHLITYLVDNNNVLHRYENDVFSFTAGVSEIADSLNSSSILAFKQLSFELFGNNEIVVGRATSGNDIKVIKLDDQGMYSSKNITLQNSSLGLRLVVFQNGNIVVAYPKSYCVLNQNLDSLTSGNFPSGIATNQSLGSKWEMGSKDNFIYDYRANGKMYKFDSGMNIVDSALYNRNLFIEGVFQKNGDIYMYGEVINPTSYSESGDVAGTTPQLNLSNIFVIKNYSTENFSEYGNIFKHNNIEFITGNLGHSFLDESWNSQNYTYQTQNGKKAGTMYFKGSEIIGVNANDELTGMISNYYGNSYALPGPVYSNVYDFNEQVDKYNRGYYVTKQMIEDHLSILNWGNPDYIPPFGIREWPAHGNVANGEAANLADFVDVNSNGIYEPMLGDYPKIFGDKCVLNMYHQSTNDPNSNQLEVHQYFFTYDCDTSEVLKNTVFENMRVINRGQDLDSTVIGSFIDYDLGGPNDDFVGTNVELGMVYVYNGDALDLTDGGSVGFNQNIPAQGMMVLNGMKLNPNGSDNAFGVAVNESVNGNGFNDGIIDNEYYTLESSMYYTNATVGFYGDPSNISEFWNVLNGKYNDGSSRDWVPGIPYRYSFFGNSDPLSYATHGYDHGNNSSELTQGNPSGDRRMMAGSGPGFFASGDTINYLTAHITSFDSTDTSVPISTDKLFVDAAWLKNAYATNDLGCGNTFGTIQEDLALEEIEQYDVTIYPNPFSNEIYITNLSNETSNIEMYDINGKSVYSTSVNGMNTLLSINVKAGIYLIHVSNDNGSVVKRVVKN